MMMMYIDVAYDEHTFWHMMYLVNLLLHDEWYGTRLMHGKVQGSSLKENIGGDIPIGGVILLPMILGGDIYHMHT